MARYSDLLTASPAATREPELGQLGIDAIVSRTIMAIRNEIAGR